MHMPSANQNSDNIAVSSKTCHLRGKKENRESSFIFSKLDLLEIFLSKSNFLEIILLS